MCQFNGYFNAIPVPENSKETMVTLPYSYYKLLTVNYILLNTLVNIHYMTNKMMCSFQLMWKK